MSCTGEQYSILTAGITPPLECLQLTQDFNRYNFTTVPAIGVDIIRLKGFLLAQEYFPPGFDMSPIFGSNLEEAVIAWQIDHVDVVTSIDSDGAGYERH